MLDLHCISVGMEFLPKNGVFGAETLDFADFISLLQLPISNSLASRKVRSLLIRFLEVDLAGGHLAPIDGPSLSMNVDVRTLFNACVCSIGFAYWRVAVEIFASH